MAANAKCLLISNIFPPIHGGSAVVYENLARFGEHRVVVLAPYRHYQSGYALVGWRDFDKSAPYQVFRTELLRPRQTKPSSRLESLLLFLRIDIPLRLKVLLAVARIIRRENIGLICIGELDSGSWIGWFVKKMFGCKVINYIHGEEITIKERYRFFGQNKERYLQRADAIVAVSTFTRNALVELMKVEEDKIELIFNGVDLERFHPRERDPALIDRYGLDGKKVLLSVGRLVERKGIDRTLQALPSVIAQHPDVVYIIVGQGPYRPVLERIAREAGVSEHVIFAGSVDDRELAAHYALCDLFVMPNRELPNGDTEGFGLVFLEANACGKPVIAGRAGGAVDAVTDGQNGLLVEGDKEQEIAEAVCKLFENSELYARLKSGSLERARVSDSRSRAKQFVALCDRLTATPMLQ